MPTVAEIKEKARRTWDIKSAGERLLWRFKQGKAFKPNDLDLDALKCLLSWVNRQTSENISNNQLFAKLYIYHLTMNIRYYETTVLNEFPVGDLHRLLSRPLSSFYKSFFIDIHNNQLNKLIDVNVEERQDVLDEYKKLQQTFTEDYIIAMLDEQMSNALNRYS